MKVSYGRNFHGNSGTHYSQRLLMSYDEFIRLRQEVEVERNNNFPNKDKYSGGLALNYIKLYLEPLELKAIDDSWICFLNLTQTRYIKKHPFIKGTERIKLDRNTYIEVTRR